MTERKSAPSATSGTAVQRALTQMAPWQRNVLFILGAIAFGMPLLDHYANGVIRGVQIDITVLHAINDGVFLFAGVLGMIPPLALRIGDRLLSWKKGSGS